MTRPVCEARAKAWRASHEARVVAIAAFPGDVRPWPPCLMAPCDRPDGCGAKAGEECLEPYTCPHCPSVAHPGVACEGVSRWGRPGVPPLDATPAIDVGALLAERDRLERERDEARAALREILRYVHPCRGLAPGCPKCEAIARATTIGGAR